MKIDLTGPLSTGDKWRVDDPPHGAIHIGDIDLVEAIHTQKFAKPVTVAIMDERYAGDLTVDVGWGYSEFTPMDPDILKVGGHDLLEILERLDGQTVRIIVSDEPVDVAACERGEEL